MTDPTARDEPAPRRRPRREGWDDGRGSRSGGAHQARTRSTGRETGRGSGRSSAGSGVLSGLPRWALPAGVGVLVVVLLGFLLTRGGGGSSNGGSCLTDLLAHLPADEREVLSGTDLVQARGAGFDDGASLEDLGASLEETGAIPDPLSFRYRISELATLDDFTARTGVEPGDIACALSDGARSVFTGRFDPAEVSGSEVGASGRLAATDDRLALARGSGIDPADLLEPAKDGGLRSADDVRAVVERLRADGAYSVVVERAAKERAAAQVGGLGVGGDGDARTLVIAWSFRDESSAKSGRAAMVSRINEVVQGATSITAADLEVDGTLVHGVVEVRRAPDLEAIVADEGVLP
ncbi:MAG: hypothetical protein KF703_19465 [Actinobacteria bacterium]|nr:hypothetical protein [Actinomycetota bacterium]